MDWATENHLIEHWEIHRNEFPGYTVDQYHISAQETVRIGREFTYIDDATRLPRFGYYHRDSARFTALDLDGKIHTHFHADEGYLFDLFNSTYTDE